MRSPLWRAQACGYVDNARALPQTQQAEAGINSIVQEEQISDRPKYRVAPSLPGSGAPFTPNQSSGHTPREARPRPLIGFAQRSSVHVFETPRPRVAGGVDCFRQCLVPAAWGISGAEARPAAPSACRRQPPLTLTGAILRCRSPRPGLQKPAMPPSSRLPAVSCTQLRDRHEGAEAGLHRFMAPFA
jgi:hypothetical protein